MRNIILTALILTFPVLLTAQTSNKEREAFNSPDFTEFPVVKFDFWTRSIQKVNKSEVSLFENDQRIQVENIREIDLPYRPVPQNKYVLILIENHYLPKGTVQRYFFKNILVNGLSGRVKRGDKYIIATFDWYRNGKYVQLPFGSEFSDDYNDITDKIASINPPAPLGNKQQGADIYDALNASLDLLSKVNDTLPKNILLLSDDFPNIVSSFDPAQIVSKSNELEIPIYAVSFNINSSRYNLVTELEICAKTNGEYHLSGKNDIKSASSELGGFIDRMNQNSLGVHRQVRYTSSQPQAAQEVSLKIDLKDAKSLKYQVEYPFQIIDWIKYRPLTFAGIILGLVLTIVLITVIISKVKRTKQLRIQKDMEMLAAQERSQHELSAIQQQQVRMTQQYESEKQALNNKLLNEKLTRKLDQMRIECQLIQTINGKTSVIPMRGIHFTIGRAPDNDLVIDQPYVSKYHLKIQFTESGQFYVTDLRSTNGTLLNNMKLTDSAMLSNGDVLSMGMVDLKFSQIKA